MNLSFQALQAGIEADILAWKPTRSSEAVAVAKKLLVNKERFLHLQNISGIPALWVMPVFEREEPSFTAYLGNGQPLDRVTTEVPAGRGPFNTWEEGAKDALTLDHITQVPQPWTWIRACYEWEAWNGFGPRMHGRPTGYVWAGTSIYQGGKYVGDRKWSRGTWDQQLGAFIIAQAIAGLDTEIAQGFAK